jgi:alkyldihydroxyacetonephosphate synthase
MRSWNGWGEEGRVDALNDSARAFLLNAVGPAVPTRDATLTEALAAAAAPPRVQGALFDASPELRLRHARGQSFPDWVALRFGRVGPLADGVALPASHEEAAAALEQAQKLGAIVIPYGGGTSVVGHLNVPAGERPVLNISLERMNRLLDLDETSLLARFGAGTPGPQVEAQLAQRGYMLGHFPQSYEYSTVGGWVVTRSSGQQSLRYGRIESLFAAGRLATPRGELRVGGFPASSAGPDLRECVLGSEGRIGLLSEATMRIRRLPEREDFHAVFFPSWELGVEAVRQLVHADIPMSMLRLSNAVETETQLTLAGHEKAIAWLKRYLRLRGSGLKPVMLMIGFTGLNREVLRTRREALGLAKLCRGVHAGKVMGKAWASKRYAGPYLRNALWDAGYAVDTCETAVNWPQASATMNAIEAAARGALGGHNEKLHAFTHLSHVYRQGCSIYSTFVFRAAPTYEENLARWTRLKRAVSEAIVASGGTISHQHGVGADHAPYLEAEKGPLGMGLIRAIAREFDPQGMLNPGKLFA